MQTASLTVDVACSQAFLCTSRAWWPWLGSAAELRASLKSLQPLRFCLSCAVLHPPLPQEPLTDAQLSLKGSLCCDSYIQPSAASWHFSLPQFGGWKLLQCCKVSSQDWGWYFCLVFWQHLQRKHRLSHYPTLVRLTGTCVLRGMTGNKWASSCWVQQNFSKKVQLRTTVHIRYDLRHLARPNLK